jgi:hypothetical protein
MNIFLKKFFFYTILESTPTLEKVKAQIGKYKNMLDH